MLKMKTRCERCASALPPASRDALICAYECTFCAACGTAMAHRCPNCAGDLLPRPPRLKTPLSVAIGLIRRRLRGRVTGTHPEQSRTDAAPLDRRPHDDQL